MSQKRKVVAKVLTSLVTKLTQDDLQGWVSVRIKPVVFKYIFSSTELYKSKWGTIYRIKLLETVMLATRSGPSRE